MPLQGASVTGTSHWPGMPAVDVPPEFVLLGDFNLTPQQPEYDRIVGEADYFYGRQRAAGHLVDSWVTSGHREDEGLTWFDESTGFVSGSRLDYIFVTPGLCDRLKGTRIDAENPASDHQPVWLELAP